MKKWKIILNENDDEQIIYANSMEFTCNDGGTVASFYANNNINAVFVNFLYCYEIKESEIENLHK
jgi:hypothetical protein